MTERETRALVCEIGRRLYQRGLIAGADGNISVRLPRGRLLVTPSGLSKGFMKPDDLVVTDLDGAPIGSGKPTSELALHLAVYRKRGDVQAVVHAHPPTAVAMTVAGITLEECVMPEVLVYMGTVPTARYATPSSPEGAKAIEELIGNHEALLLDRHGAVTVGPDLPTAWERMEKIEQFAQIVVSARLLGGVRVLSAEELERLEKNAATLGHSVDTSVCPISPQGVDIEKIADAVAEGIKASGT
ncbi:MAG: class II aldolase/adducin family protein [Planctomycetes bacterium]|nr:class II aldolase/adducin family protein [Planctomycetota bacterium]